MPDNNEIEKDLFFDAYIIGDTDQIGSIIRELFSQRKQFNQGTVDGLVFVVRRDKEKGITKGEEFFNICMDLIESEAPEEGNYKSDLIRYVYERLTREYSREHLEERHISRITGLYKRFVPEEQRRADQRPQKTMEDYIREHEIERQETLRRVRAEREARKAQEAEQERQARQREILEEGQQDISLLFPLGIRRRPSPESSDRSSSSDSERSR